MSKRKGRNKKRLFPRKYSSDYIDTSRGIDAVKVRDHEIFAYTKRVGTSFTSVEVPSRKVEEKNKPIRNSELHERFPPKPVSDIPQERGVNRKAFPLGYDPLMTPEEVKAGEVREPPPKYAKVERLHEIWQSERMTHFDEYNFYVLGSYLDVTYKMFFKGTRWLIIKETAEFIYVSIFYPSKAWATRRWERGDNEITWKAKYPRSQRDIFIEE